MANGQRRDLDRERFWREALGRQEGSGLSVRAFCLREGLAETALYSWRRVLRERDGEGGRPGFVPVAVVAGEGGGDDADSLPIVIELRGGRLMRLGTSMAAGRVAAIVHAIESGDGRPGAGGGGA